MLASALAACGSGSSINPPGGGGSQPTTPPAGYYGLTIPSNATFSLSGQSTTTTTYNYPNIPGVATPYPTKVLTAAVTQAGSVGNLAGNGGASDIHVVETDAFPTVTHVLTSDNFYLQSKTAFSQFKSLQADEAGDKFTYDWTQFPYQLDVIPETPGATWTNTASLVYNETDADGTVSNRTYAKNGTYVENSTLGGGLGSATITENSDGSGTYVGPFGAGSEFVFSAPSGGSISIHNVPQTNSDTFVAPDWVTPWLSAHGFYSETDTLSATTNFPGPCVVPSTFGSSGNAITQTISRLDTIIGYTESETITTYTAPNAGPVCVQLTDAQTAYYDYQDDYKDGVHAHYHFPGINLSTATISETVALQSKTGFAHAMHAQSAQQALQQLSSSSAFMVARGSFQRVVEQERRDRVKSFRQFVINGTKGGQL